MSFTTRQKTSDGREYVAVFDDPNSTTPTKRYVYAPDGSLESEDGKSVPPAPVEWNGLD